MTAHMVLILHLAIAVSASLAILVDWRGHRPAFLALKPLTTLLVVALAAANTTGMENLVLLAALLLCLLGDIAIMQETQRGFLGGLLSFLLAHLILIALFLHRADAMPLLALHYAVPLAVCAFAAIGAALVPALRQIDRPAALVYTAVLLTMSFAAFRFSTLAGFGAAMFVLSDAVLAYKTFRHDSRIAQAIVLTTYWLAITLIVDAFPVSVI